MDRRAADASCFLLLLVVVAPAAAEEPATVVLGAGASAIWHHNSNMDHTVAIFSAEYRSGRALFRDVKPLVGAFATSDGAAYAHFGLYSDFHPGKRWILAPHASVGAYSHGTQNDQGGTLEFQLGLDLFYQLAGGWRVGATARHVSNAGTGHANPGSEELGLLVAFPLR